MEHFPREHDSKPAKAWTPLTDGEQLAFEADGVLVRLQCVRPGAAYAVTVERGTSRVEELCASYADEGQARVVARMCAELYLWINLVETNATAA